MTNLPDSVAAERFDRIAVALDRKGLPKDPAFLADLIEDMPLARDSEIISCFEDAERLLPVENREMFRSLLDVPVSKSREPYFRVKPEMRQGWAAFVFPYTVHEEVYPPGSRRAARLEPLAAYRRLYPDATAAQAALATGRSMNRMLADMVSGAVVLKKGLPKMELTELKRDQLVAVHNFLAGKVKAAAVRGFKSGDIARQKIGALLEDYTAKEGEQELSALVELAEKKAKKVKAKGNGDSTPTPRAPKTAVGKDDSGYREGSVRQKAHRFWSDAGFADIKVADLISHLYGESPNGKTAINGVIRGLKKDAVEGRLNGRVATEKRADGIYLVLHAS